MSAKDRVIEAARAVVAAKTDTFEKSFAVPDDPMYALQGALADYDKWRADLMETAKGATGG